MLQRIHQWLREKFTTSTAIMLLVVLAVGGFLAMTINTLNNNYNLQRQVDNARLDNQISELQNQNLRLERQYYQTSEYQELMARSLMGKALPGEHLVLLPKTQAANSAKNDGVAQTEKSNLDQWLDFLLGQHN